MSMNTPQKLALSIGILGFLAGGGTQLTDILAPLGSAAPVVVKEIVSLAGFVSGILGIILSFTTGQAGQLAAVQDMPGVEKILVNANANATLATMAVNTDQPKIQPTPEAKAAVTSTASAAAQ